MTDFYHDVPSTYVDIPLTQEEDEDIENLASRHKDNIDRRLGLGSSLDNHGEYYEQLPGCQPWKSTMLTEQVSGVLEILNRSGYLQEKKRTWKKKKKGKTSVLHTGTRDSIKPSMSCDLFQEMLKAAIAAAYQFPSGMRSDWIRILSERSLEQWVNDISEITLHQFKSLLVHSIEPSFQELEALDSLDTNLMGVYLSSIKQEDGFGKKYLYIGSASSERGLDHRINQHQNKAYSVREVEKGSFHHRLLNQASVRRYARYMFACVAKSWAPAGTDQYYHLRKTVVLAEAIYTHWLFGIWAKDLETQYSILPICPWDSSCLSWEGCCRFSPFTFPLPGKFSNLTLAERRLNTRERQKLKYASLSPQERKELRERIYKREGSDFHLVPIKGSYKRVKKQLQKSNVERSRARQTCAFCGSEKHLITGCEAPGKADFMKNAWKGRYYHLAKEKDLEKSPEKPKPVMDIVRARPAPRCSVCKEEGHNIRTCPNPEAAEFHYARRCSTCRGTSHNCLKCPLNNPGPA
ncbi:hypothetical protein N7540_012654 [Penicillium herquei]|nr:hypothetical protein N7540_012654 [Penicillium herquei]